MTNYFGPLFFLFLAFGLREILKRRLKSGDVDICGVWNRTLSVLIGLAISALGIGYLFTSVSSTDPVAAIPIFIFMPLIVLISLALILTSLFAKAPAFEKLILYIVR
jgi:hypothetical protein